jgi:hypothetical protein
VCGSAVLSRMLADGHGGAGLLLDAELDLQRLAALDGEEIEAAGLRAKVVEEVGVALGS